RIERTEELANQALEIINESAGKNKQGEDNIDVSVGYVGLIPSSYPINNIFLWTRGPEEAVLRISLKNGSGVRVEDLKQQLRDQLPPQLADQFAKRLRSEGLSEEKITERVKGLKLSFEPADIVNEVMSFGSPTPVEVAISGLSFTGPKAAGHKTYVNRMEKELRTIPSLRDFQFAQSLDYPAVAVSVDRERAGLSGVTTGEVARSLVSATSSSRFVVPIFWAAPDTGIGYQVQVEIPPYQMNSAQEIGMVPVKGVGNQQLLLRDVAGVHEEKIPAEYDRYNMQRLLSLTANIEGEDLGRVAGRIGRALSDVNASLWVSDRDAQGKPVWKNEISGEIVEAKVRPRSPPRGLTVDVRGQVVPMQQMFGALAGGKIYEGITLG